MNLEDYQPMSVVAIKVCKGARYQNLWWVEEMSRHTDYTIHFWIYWEVLQAVTIKVLCLLDAVVVKYKRIMQFSIRPHSIHI